MKTLVLIVLAVAAFASVEQLFLQEDPVIVAQWQDFMVKYNKFYENDGEHAKRYLIFKKNLDVIASAQANDPSAEYGVTQFADISTEEFKAQYLGFRGTVEDRENAPLLKYEKKIDAPDAYDWREHGAVTPVKNQGGCGSCWAFSAAQNIEGQQQIHHQKLLNFSEQQIVDCDTKGEDQGCNGGLMDLAFKYINETGGLETEEDYPYEGVDDDCRFDISKVQVKVTGYGFLSKDEGEIATGLVNVGPLSIALNAMNLQFYIAGISDPLICPAAELDHGVLMVGYAVSKGGRPYWIVKNSWGRGWGERGYFKMIRGKGKCGINTYVLSSVIA